MNGQTDDDFVLTLAKWFKYELFSWVNKPKCERCGLGGAPMEAQRTSPPATPLEHTGKASRVEVSRGREVIQESSVFKISRKGFASKQAQNFSLSSTGVQVYA